MAAAAKKVTAVPAPSGTHLPVEPMEPAPVAAFKDAVKRRAGSLKPYQMAASDFDVAFITPVLNYAAQSQPNRLSATGPNTSPTSRRCCSSA